MVNTGALFTKNFYNKYINQNATDKRLLWMGRYSGLGLSALAVLFALSIKMFFMHFFSLRPLQLFMGIIFLGGLIWKKQTRYGAAAALIVSVSALYAANYFTAGELVLVYKWTRPLSVLQWHRVSLSSGL
jgi:Na+/proline symporter